MRISEVQVCFGCTIKDKITLLITFAGCKRKTCNNLICNSKRLFNYESGIYYKSYYATIIKFIKSGLLDCITLTGGEPLDQNKKHFNDFLIFIKSFHLPVDLLTCYKEEELDDSYKNLFDNIIYKETK